MKRMHLLLSLVVLAAVAVNPVGAVTQTTAWCDLVDSGGSRTYNYHLMSGESDDFITYFHVYSPAPVSVITGHTTATDWEFVVDPDPGTGGSDIYWYYNNPESITPGLGYGGLLEVSITTSADVPQQDDFIVPPDTFGEYMGNWGYDTDKYWYMGTLVMVGSLPVPSAVPEPSAFAAISAGLIGLMLRRRS